MSGKYKPQVSLGCESHVMQWNPVLNIYRVNRYPVLTLEDKIKNFRYEEERLDFVEELLDRNLDHCANLVLSFFNFHELMGLQLVSQTWNQFICTFVFKRRVERFIQQDESLQELAEIEGWSHQLFKPIHKVSEPYLYKKMCAKVYLLKDVWRFREPKAKRLFCDSFVLSVRSDDTVIFCGLNNGCVQAWDISYLGRIREQECHDKGVKCIDFNSSVFLTGSYDMMFKVWRRDNWTCLKTFPVHTDSVWDLKLHNDVVVTAGLDGAVIVYDFISNYDLNIRCYIQAHGDLVSAVDFSSTHLVAGFEDALLSVWDIASGNKVHSLTGHSGGVTGIQIQGHLAASASYDTTVRLWDVEQGVCLITLTEHDNFARCVGFVGNRIVSGDFGGNILLWDLSFNQSDSGPKVTVINKRQWQSHKGHVVCIQLNARRIISGSRDRTLMINDFWLKTMNALESKKTSDNPKYSRFLKRPLH